MGLDLVLPIKVSSIIDELESKGYEAYVVGGCVRDAILGLEPKDWDITTNAKPNEIQAIFEKTIPTGIKHGTVTVMIEGEGFEVTTYRVDGDYSDGRHPDSVEFTSSLKDDLARRDFTINAMAYNPRVGIVDEFGGLFALENRYIKCVGNAKNRFKEDALRIMRGIRFANNLGFSIETMTKFAMIDSANLMVNVSNERVRDELNKILLNEEGCAKGLTLLLETKVLDIILPELSKTNYVAQNNPYHIYNVFKHTIKATNIIENELHLKLSALLHDLGKVTTKTTDENGVDHFYGHEVESVNVAEVVLRRLRYDNVTINKVLTLIKFHDRNIEPKYKAVRRFLSQIGDYELFKDWVKVRWVDMLAQNPKHLKDRSRKLFLVENIAQEIMETQQPLSVKDLDINGNDLISLGYRGKEIGDILKYLLEIVIDEPNANYKDYLLSKAKMIHS